VGLDQLLHVLREEAANEERRLREEAARQAELIVADARAAADRLVAAAVAREKAAGAARVRAVRDAAGLERERALLGEARRQLGRLREDALASLPAAVTDAEVERFVAELVAEAGPVAAVLVVDPGSAAAAGRALDTLGVRQRPEIREAPAARGGVQLITGALELDDTVASRLERAWPRVEPEIAAILFSGD
jgi:vacuolar-type H+-ATPase subunit E/Vma4